MRLQTVRPPSPQSLSPQSRRRGAGTVGHARALIMLTLVILGASALATVAFVLGKRSGAREVAAAHAELEARRTRLERPRWKAPVLPALRAPAQAAPPELLPGVNDDETTSDPHAPITHTRSDDDRFFDAYFGELNAALEVQGRSSARTAEIHLGAAAVLADHPLGRLDEVSCSEALCRIIVRGANDETRAHFAARFPALMAGHLGAATVHVADDTDRVVAYFATLGGALPPPSFQPPGPAVMGVGQ